MNTFCAVMFFFLSSIALANIPEYIKSVRIEFNFNMRGSVPDILASRKLLIETSPERKVQVKLIHHDKTVPVMELNGSGKLKAKKSLVASPISLLDSTKKSLSSLRGSYRLEFTDEATNSKSTLEFELEDIIPYSVTNSSELLSIVPQFLSPRQASLLDPSKPNVFPLEAGSQKIQWFHDAKSDFSPLNRKVFLSVGGRLVRGEGRNFYFKEQLSDGQEFKFVDIVPDEVDNLAWIQIKESKILRDYPKLTIAREIANSTHFKAPR